MTGANAFEALTKADLAVLDLRHETRQHPRSATFEPCGIGGHWTGTRAVSWSPAPALDTVQNGRGRLSPPLYGSLLGRDAVWRVLTDGYANHFGACDLESVRAACRGAAPEIRAAERGITTDDGFGNSFLYGMSVENQGEPMSDAVRAAWEQGIAAVCHENDWTAGHYIGHSAGTRRKVDFSSAEHTRTKAGVEGWLQLMTEIPVGPYGVTHQRFVPGFRLDDRIVDDRIGVTPAGDPWHIQLGEDGHVYCYGAVPYVGGPADDLRIAQGVYRLFGEPAEIHPVMGDRGNRHVVGYRIITDRGYPYEYTRSAPALRDE